MEENIQQPRHVLDRFTTIILVFLLCASAVLLVSKTFLLPRFTSITLNGQSHSVIELTNYQAKLVADVKDLQTRRDNLLMPVTDAQYLALADERREMPVLTELQRQLTQAALKIERDGKSVIRVHQVQLQPKNKTVELQGRVATGKQAATAFAEYLEALRHLTSVTSITGSRLRHVPGPNGSTQTNFIITLGIQ